MILVEELVRGRDIGCVVGLLVQCEMATAVIHAHGSDALRQEWLVPAIKGERIAALGVSEPGGGSDVASLQTTAKGRRRRLRDQRLEDLHLERGSGGLRDARRPHGRPRDRTA